MPRITIDVPRVNVPQPPRPSISTPSSGLEALGAGLQKIGSIAGVVQSPDQGYQAYLEDLNELNAAQLKFQESGADTTDGGVGLGKVLNDTANKLLARRNDQFSSDRRSRDTYSRLLVGNVAKRVNNAAEDSFATAVAKKGALLQAEVNQFNDDAVTSSNTTINTSLGITNFADDVTNLVEAVHDSTRGPDNPAGIIEQDKADALLRTQLRGVAVERLVNDLRNDPGAGLLELGEDALRVHQPVLEDGKTVIREDGSLETRLTRLTTDERESVRQTLRNILADRNNIAAAARDASERTRQLEENMFLNFMYDDIAHETAIGGLERLKKAVSIEIHATELPEPGTEGSASILQPSNSRLLFDAIEARANKIRQGDIPGATEEFNKVLAEVGVTSYNIPQAARRKREVLTNELLGVDQQTVLINKINENVQRTISQAEKSTIELATKSVAVSGILSAFAPNEAVATARVQSRAQSEFTRQASALSKGEITHLQIALPIIAEEQELVFGQINRSVPAIAKLVKGRLAEWFRARRSGATQAITPQEYLREVARTVPVGESDRIFFDIHLLNEMESFDQMIGEGFEFDPQAPTKFPNVEEMIRAFVERNKPAPVEQRVR